MDTLFELPPKVAKERKPFEKTQQWICKRCKGSVHDKLGAYCERFDLCLEFEQGQALLTQNGQPIKCDGKTMNTDRFNSEGSDTLVYTGRELPVYEIACADDRCHMMSDTYVNNAPYCAECVEERYGDAIHYLIEQMGGDTSYSGFDVVNDENENLVAVELDAEVLGMEQHLKFAVEKLEQFKDVYGVA